MDTLLSRNQNHSGLPVIALLGPYDIKMRLAQNVRARRLADNMSRKTLAVRSGVPEATLKRFENTGEISLSALVSIAFSLGCYEEFLSLFPEKPIIRVEDFQKQARQRGRK